MEFVIHRVNTINKLRNIPEIYGCEIDIRADRSNLILNHDPFKKGEKLENFLDEYKNGTLVLNIKESGIEDKVLEEVRKREIKSYFLLDVEAPYLYKAIEKGERNISLRFSEYEPIENTIVFDNKFDWLWIDVITRLPIDKYNIEIIKKYKTCLVCPSRWNKTNIKEIKNNLNSLNYLPNFVMTEIDFVKEWK